MGTLFFILPAIQTIRSNDRNYKDGEQNSLVQIESTNDPKFIKGMDPLGIIVIQIMRCSKICEILPEFQPSC